MIMGTSKRIVQRCPLNSQRKKQKKVGLKPEKTRLTLDRHKKYGRNMGSQNNRKEYAVQKPQPEESNKFVEMENKGGETRLEEEMGPEAGDEAYIRRERLARQGQTSRNNNST